MRTEILFMPLGGGQRVGASCYFLRIGKTNILLDAGTGIERDLKFGPDFYSLLTSPYLQSMNQINQIYISHAHMDHIGCLLDLMKQSSMATVYMTEITKVFAKYQLYERVYLNGNHEDESNRLLDSHLFDKISTVTYMKTMDFGSYKVTFYPAGHIPGAMMTLFEVGKRKILYTGDYSLSSTLLTSGCFLPENMGIDTIIMCGLHAKHPDYCKNEDALFKQVKYVLNKVQKRRSSICCYIPQLSKGIEFLKALNKENSMGVEIYLDSSIMNMVEQMERLHIPLLTQYNKVVGSFSPNKTHILLTSNRSFKGYGNYEEVKIDFSLHEDFSDMKAFIKKINPRQAIIVHCAKEYSPFDETIEQQLMMDGECRTQFIFAEEKEIYKL